MRAALAEADAHAPSIPVIANVTGAPHPNDPDDIRRSLVKQLVSPVRWVDSMSTLIGDGHRVFVEAGPGKVLTGLMRDISRDVKMFNVQDVDTLTKFRAARAEIQA